MDGAYFLTERTKFIRAFFDSAVAPFTEIIRLIGSEEHPFEPPYSEDGEPAFLEEWLDADAAIELIGRTCVSMLSESLKLYLGEWERQLGLKCQKSAAAIFKKSGFLHGYRHCLEPLTNTPWTSGPFDLRTIEQVIHARNDAAHPNEISSLRIRHKNSLKEGNRSLFFARNEELAFFPEKESLGWNIMGPELFISHEKLFCAIDEVDIMVSWLEPQMFNLKYPSR